MIYRKAALKWDILLAWIQGGTVTGTESVQSFVSRTCANIICCRIIIPAEQTSRFCGSSLIVELYYGKPCIVALLVIISTELWPFKYNAAIYSRKGLPLIPANAKMLFQGIYERRHTLRARYQQRLKCDRSFVDKSEMIIIIDDETTIIEPRFWNGLEHFIPQRYSRRKCGKHWTHPDYPGLTYVHILSEIDWCPPSNEEVQSMEISIK